MTPLIITQPLRVLVIGAGKAGLIKLKSALRYQSDVSLMSIDTGLPQLNSAFEFNGPFINADFYQLSTDAIDEYDLIYLAIPWPEEVELQMFIKDWASNTLAKNKLLCVSCQPALGNVVNPCSRQVNGFTVTLSGAQMRPSISRDLCEFMAEKLSQKLNADDAISARPVTQYLVSKTNSKKTVASFKETHETS